jgi:hypothetical protein
MQQKKKPFNPAVEQVKGIFFFHEGEEIYDKALALLKTLNCVVINDNVNRITVKTSRGNLQSIKTCWLAKDGSSTLSQELNEYVSQIIIGGRA